MNTRAKGRRVVGTYTHPRPARVWDGPIPGTHEPGFVEQPLVPIEVPAAIRRVVHGDGASPLDLYAFTMGECRVILGREPAAGGPLRWHMTISCRDRHPSWDEIKTARYRLLGPDLATAMFLPPAAHYVNVEKQDHVFQVWELLDDEAREAWTQT